MQIIITTSILYQSIVFPYITMIPELTIALMSNIMLRLRSELSFLKRLKFFTEVKWIRPSAFYMANNDNFYIILVYCFRLYDLDTNNAC